MTGRTRKTRRLPDTIEAGVSEGRCFGSKGEPKHPRGLFLSIEGIEGAGKTTLAEALAKRLRSAGHEVVLTREPGGTRIGDAIREVLLSGGKEMCDRTELLLFEASRAQHVDELIGPALGRGAVVICDRFIDSSLAYQGGARMIEPRIVKTLNQFATRGLEPDLTILLDLPAEVGLGRQKLIDRISSEGLAFHEAVRRGYLELALAEQERYVVIDATKGFDEVQDIALQAVGRAQGEATG